MIKQESVINVDAMCANESSLMCFIKMQGKQYNILMNLYLTYHMVENMRESLFSMQLMRLTVY